MAEEKKKKYLYEKTRYPGILRYTGNNEAYVIDFYAGGKRRREKIEGGLTKAREELEKRRKAGRTGSFIPQIKLNRATIEDLVKKYKGERSGDSYFEKTEAHYVDMIGKYFEGRKLMSIRAEDFDQFFKDRMAVLKKDGKPRSNCCVNREVALLRHLLNKAVYWDMLEVNPFHRFAKERSAGGSKPVFLEEAKRERILKPEELDAIFPNCHPYLRNIVQGLLLTGLRVRDLLNLRWEDIDWQEQVIHYTEKKKHDKKGTKPLTEDLVNLLKSIHRTDRDKGFIFVGHQGRPIKNPPKGFDRMRKKAGIKDLRMRDLRRSSATALLRRGASLPAVQKHLGHTEIAMTMEYLHLENEHLREELKKLDGYFSPSQKFYGEKMVRNGQKESLPISEEAHNA